MTFLAVLSCSSRSFQRIRELATDCEQHFEERKRAGQSFSARSFETIQTAVIRSGTTLATASRRGSSFAVARFSGNSGADTQRASASIAEEKNVEKDEEVSSAGPHGDLELGLSNARSALNEKLKSSHESLRDELFDLIDLNKDGELTQDEVVASHSLLGLSAAEAGALFDELDVKNEGRLFKDDIGGDFLGSLSQSAGIFQLSNFSPGMSGVFGSGDAPGTTI